LRTPRAIQRMHQQRGMQLPQTQSTHVCVQFSTLRYRNRSLHVATQTGQAGRTGRRARRQALGMHGMQYAGNSRLPCSPSLPAPLHDTARSSKVPATSSLVFFGFPSAPYSAIRDYVRLTHLGPRTPLQLFRPLPRSPPRSPLNIWHSMYMPSLFKLRSRTTLSVCDLDLSFALQTIRTVGVIAVPTTKHVTRGG
jgi:hypothetical protein